MPRGMPAGSDKWTFHVQRYKCPYCHRRGLIKVWYTDSGLSLTCMYKSGYKKDCKSPFLIGKNIQHKIDKSKELVYEINNWIETIYHK